MPGLTGSFLTIWYKKGAAEATPLSRESLVLRSAGFAFDAIRNGLDVVADAAERVATSHSEAASDEAKS